MAPQRTTSRKAYDEGPLSGLTGTQRAIVALRQGIRTGRYVPGQRLVEADLVKELQVGRNSLREAFSRLASDGVLLVEPHRGASIRRRTREEIAALYDICEVLEGLAARQAAERIDRPGNRDLLAKAAERQAEAVPVGVIQQIDQAANFHDAILIVADNPPLRELCNNLHILTFSFQLRHAQLTGGHPMGEHSLNDHRLLVEVIGSGDPQRAEDVMRQHMRDGKARLMTLPDNAFG